MKKYISFITSVIALLTAILGLYRGLQHGSTIQQQGKVIQQQQQEIDALRAFASSMAVDLTIERPREGQALPPVYDDMQGAFFGAVPFNHKLWVLAKDRYNYFLMYPPPQVAHVA